MIGGSPQATGRAIGNALIGTPKRTAIILFKRGRLG